MSRYRYPPDLRLLIDEAEAYTKLIGLLLLKGHPPDDSDYLDAAVDNLIAAAGSYSAAAAAAGAMPSPRSPVHRLCHAAVDYTTYPSDAELSALLTAASAYARKHGKWVIA